MSEGKGGGKHEGPTDGAHAAPAATPSVAVTATAQALRAIDEVRDRLDGAHAREDLAALAAEVHSRLTSALETLEAAASKAIEDISGSAAVPRALQEELAEAERRIRRNPLGAVVVAAGVGLLAGLLLRRR